MRLVAVLALAASFLGCERQPQEQFEELYFPTDTAVGFDILPAGNAVAGQQWSATYLDQDGKTTKFRVELPAAPGDAAFPASGQGKFISEPGSDPLPLLTSLKTALQARRIPHTAQKVDALAFDFMLAGAHQSRSPKGLSASPKGNWISLKISFGRGKGEVILNLNPVIHKAEFALKDPAEGDLVLAELAKVF